MAMIVTLHLLIDEDNSLDSSVTVNDIMRPLVRDNPKVLDYAFSAILSGGRQDKAFPCDPETYQDGQFVDALKRELP